VTEAERARNPGVLQELSKKHLKLAVGSTGSYPPAQEGIPSGAISNEVYITKGKSPGFSRKRRAEP
ncbi:MAG TPA: hypothetical protein VF553_00050, partial [Pyrinomonadaceae bacterium]